ncbi:MAG: M42 family metallopeptidase [Anaerolineae bacterium]
MMADLRATLEKLSNEFGPSGHEKAVRELIKKEIEGLVDRLDVDAMGNLIAFKAGVGPEPRLKLMVSAHMDEIGFMVLQVEKSGLLRFARVGGVDGRMLLGKRVVVGDERMPGVIGLKPPHLTNNNESERIPDIEDLAIDIGAGDEKAAGAKVKVGDYGTFATRFAVLSEDPAWPTVRGKAFDDRAGCTALIGLLAERYPVDLYAVFTVQEEVGLRGARVAAYRVAPDAAIALEGTICDDTPKAPDEDVSPVTRLGAGPAITLMDRSLVSHPGMVKLLQDTAAAEGIAIQYKEPALGGTDSGAIHLTRAGVPAVTVAVPCRYIHSPASILNLNDLANTVKLVAAALKRVERSYLVRKM